MKKKTKSKPKVPAVSVRGETFDRLKRYCEKKGLKPGRLVDELCVAFFEGREPRLSGGGNGRLFAEEELSNAPR